MIDQLPMKPPGVWAASDTTPFRPPGVWTTCDQQSISNLEENSAARESAVLVAKGTFLAKVHKLYKTSSSLPESDDETTLPSPSRRDSLDTANAGDDEDSDHNEERLISSMEERPNWWTPEDETALQERLLSNDPPVSTLPSLGSGLHAAGRCRPCGFFHGRSGCSHGHKCFHCHSCQPTEVKNRKKEKLEKIRARELEEPKASP
jgi:hypothetical protein